MSCKSTRHVRVTPLGLCLEMVKTIGEEVKCRRGDELMQDIKERCFFPDLCSEASPSNRFASIHVVSSGYSTNHLSKSGCSFIRSWISIQSLDNNNGSILTNSDEFFSAFFNREAINKRFDAFKLTYSEIQKSETTLA